MAVGGKFLVGIVVFLGVIFQSPHMIFKTGILQKVLKNLNASDPLVRLVKSGIIMSKASSSTSNVRLLGQDEAIKIDQDLFNEYRFSVDQLMELAGLSVASVIQRLYAASHKDLPILVVAGPGNNGGDGMVAARHLKVFGFSDVTLLAAKKPSKELFLNLVHQAELNDVTVSFQPDQFLNQSTPKLIVDALFGFSFKPPVRPEYQPLMDILTSAESKAVPVVAIDIPSGWDVEQGPSESLNFMPQTLVSLTAPKRCASYFTGKYHFLGGRFVPDKLAAKYNLNLPSYPGIDCIVQLN